MWLCAYLVCNDPSARMRSEDYGTWSVGLSVCLSVRASSRTTGYEAGNEWHQRVVNNEEMDIMWRFS